MPSTTYSKLQARITLSKPSLCHVLRPRATIAARNSARWDVSGALPFKSAGKVIAGAPFDFVARAGLWRVIVRTGASNVDEHFAGVALADVAKARDSAAVRGVTIVVFGRSRWRYRLKEAKVVGNKMGAGREIEKRSGDHVVCCEC